MQSGSCPRCGAALPPQVRFCIQCGLHLPDLEGTPRGGAPAPGEPTATPGFPPTAGPPPTSGPAPGPPAAPGFPPTSAPPFPIGQQPPFIPQGAAPQPPRRRRKGVLIALIAGVAILALVAAGVLLWPGKPALVTSNEVNQPRLSKPPTQRWSATPFTSATSVFAVGQSADDDVLVLFSGEGQLIALDGDTGNLAWSYQAGSASSCWSRTPTILVCTDDGGSVTYLDVRTGEEKFTTGHAARTMPFVGAAPDAKTFYELTFSGANTAQGEVAHITARSADTFQEKWTATAKGTQTRETWLTATDTAVIVSGTHGDAVSLAWSATDGTQLHSIPIGVYRWATPDLLVGHGESVSIVHRTGEPVAQPVSAAGDMTQLPVHYDRPPPVFFVCTAESARTCGGSLTAVDPDGVAQFSLPASYIERYCGEHWITTAADNSALQGFDNRGQLVWSERQNTSDFPQNQCRSGQLLQFADTGVTARSASTGQVEWTLPMPSTDGYLQTIQTKRGFLLLTRAAGSGNSGSTWTATSFG